MKKYALCILITCLAFLILNLMIPQRLTISKSILINANPVSISRFISDPAKTSGILNNPRYPAGKNTKGSCALTVPVRMIGSAFHPGTMTIESSCRINNNRLNLISFNDTSCVANWGFNFILGTNVFQKLYFLPQFLRSREELYSRLNYFKNYLENDSNLYGILIREQTVTDSLVLVVEKSLHTRPVPADIYAQVKLLQQYVTHQGARQVNHPMLHVDSMSSQHFQLMVAVPINIPVADSAGLKSRRLVVGNLLVAEVKGGPKVISDASVSMQNFLQDHRKSSPAVPYESMVTNRFTQPDSSNWITRLCYPVF